MTSRHEHKTCSTCHQAKPLSAFRPKRNGEPEASCARCRDRRKRSTAKVVYNRARQRAIQELATENPDRLEELIALWIPVVQAELEKLGGAEVKLRPGARLKGQSPLDRIREVCPDCANYHESGHTCGTCGSNPEQPTRVIRTSEGQLRFSRTETVVLKP